MPYMNGDENYDLEELMSASLAEYLPEDPNGIMTFLTPRMARRIHFLSFVQCLGGPNDKIVGFATVKIISPLTFSIPPLLMPSRKFNVL